MTPEGQGRVGNPTKPQPRPDTRARRLCLRRSAERDQRPAAGLVEGASAVLAAGGPGGAKVIQCPALVWPLVFVGPWPALASVGGRGLCGRGAVVSVHEHDDADLLRGEGDGR